MDDFDQKSLLNSAFPDLEIMELPSDLNWDKVSTPVLRDSSPILISPLPLTLPIPKRQRDAASKLSMIEHQFDVPRYPYDLNWPLLHNLHKSPSDSVLKDKFEALTYEDDLLLGTSYTLPDNYYLLDSFSNQQNSLKSGQRSVTKYEVRSVLSRQSSYTSLLTNCSTFRISSLSETPRELEGNEHNLIDVQFKDYNTDEILKPVYLYRSTCPISPGYSLHSFNMQKKHRDAIPSKPEISNYISSENHDFFLNAMYQNLNPLQTCSARFTKYSHFSWIAAWIFIILSFLRTALTMGLFYLSKMVLLQCLYRDTNSESNKQNLCSNHADLIRIKGRRLSEFNGTDKKYTDYTKADPHPFNRRLRHSKTVHRYNNIRLEPVQQRSYLHLIPDIYVYRIDTIEEFYTIGPTLGMGGEGHVKLCIPVQLAHYLTSPAKYIFHDKQLFLNQLLQDLRTLDHLYAIKIVSQLNWKSHQDVYSMTNYLCTIHHPSIVQHHAVYADQYNFYILMDYIEGSDLMEYLSSLKSVSEQRCCEIFQQILIAIDAVHQAKLIHRDIKPENFLSVSSENEKSKYPRIVLIDFGIAVHEKSVSTSYPIGTPTYMAPELFLHNSTSALKHSDRSDMWSAGVILCQLLTGRTPFDRHGPKSLLKIAQSKKSITDESSTTTNNQVMFSFDGIPNLFDQNNLVDIKNKDESNAVLYASSDASQEFCKEDSYFTCIRVFRSEEMIVSEKTQNCISIESEKSFYPASCHARNRRRPTSHFGRGTLRFAPCPSSKGHNFRSRSFIDLKRKTKENKFRLKDVPIEQSRNIEFMKSRSKSVTFASLGNKSQEDVRDTISMETPNYIIEFEGDEWNHVTTEAKNLVRLLLAFDPSQRISAQKALEHPWFDLLNTIESTGTGKSMEQFRQEMPEDVRERWRRFLK